MVRVRDYTKLAPGTIFSEKEAKTCPHCGRVGLLENEGGIDFYVHSETLGYDEQPNLIVNWVQCPKMTS
jgi:hypothetical protein